MASPLPGRPSRHTWNDSSDEEEDARLRDEGGVLSNLTAEWTSSPPSPPPSSSLVPDVAYTSPHPPHFSLRVLLSPSQGLSFQLWPAALLLCQYLDSPPIRSLLPSLRIVELGAGCGLVGLLAAALGAQVTVTDLPHVVGHLEANVAVNAPPFVQSQGVEGGPTVGKHPSGGSVRCTALTWGEGEEGVVSAGLGGVDWVLLADCVYWEELFDPLLDSLTALCSPSTRVLLSQTVRRHRVEGRFFKRAKKRRLSFHRMDEWHRLHSDGQPMYLYSTSEDGRR